ncbi:hypothetical protein N8Z07_03680 [Pelagibacteraceae bacterium]|nr:hypothetical protein [Pelagibacteraceae bacterium]
MSITFKKAFSLVEILVALLITSMIGIALLSLNQSANKDFEQVTETNKIQSESEMLFALLENDLARGGFVHPIRGDVSNLDNCIADISAENAVLLISGTAVSACFDKPSFDGSVAYRYKVTYKKGPTGSSEASDPNTIYKMVERTDDCTTIKNGSTAPIDPNHATTVHSWQPVSDNISVASFTYPTINGVQKNDLLDVRITFKSNESSDAIVALKKNVFLRNKKLGSNSTNCRTYCPNSKLIFKDYVVSDNTSFWPLTNTIPSARILISNRHASDEDYLEHDADLATEYGLTVSFDNDTGLLSINGNSSAANYQNFIRKIRYVNTINTVADRTTYSDLVKDRRISLSLGFPGICNDLLPRKVGTVKHFYCHVTIRNGTDEMQGKVKPGAPGNWTWPVGRNNGWPYWTQAKLRAESTNYYNLKGYLVTITSEAERQFILNKVRDGGNVPPVWLGGTDLDRTGEWKWTSGPEAFILGTPDDDDTGLPQIFDNVRENCQVGTTKYDVWEEGDPDSNLYCYPGYAGIGIGVFYRDQGGRYCRTNNCNASQVPNLNNERDDAFNAWGPREPNDYCCRGFETNTFTEQTYGEIIPDTYANIYLGQWSIAELDEHFKNAEGEYTKVNGLPLETGNIYFNTTDHELKKWDGDSWEDVALTDYNMPYNSATYPYQRHVNRSYYTDSNKWHTRRRNSGENYLQFRRDGQWNDLWANGITGGSLETKGYINEFSTDWKTMSECSNASDDNRYACVNYYAEFNITLDDFSFQDIEMLDFCDITPGLPGE